PACRTSRVVRRPALGRAARYPTGTGDFTVPYFPDGYHGALPGPTGRRRRLAWWTGRLLGRLPEPPRRRADRRQVDAARLHGAAPARAAVRRAARPRGCRDAEGPHADAALARAGRPRHPHRLRRGPPARRVRAHRPRA